MLASSRIPSSVSHLSGTLRSRNTQKGYVRGGVDGTVRAYKGRQVVSTRMTLAPLQSLWKRVSLEPADNSLGALAKTLLPGPALYLPAVLIPVLTTFAASGAVHGVTWLQWLAHVACGEKLGWLLDSRDWTFDGRIDWPLLISTMFAGAGALSTFVALPALDLALGRDLAVDDEDRLVRLGESNGYRSVLHATAALHCVALAATCYTAGTGNLHPLVFGALVISQSGCGSVMLTVVHELVHCRHRGSATLASALLATVGSMHWSCAHFAHHLNVGKFDDPATARRGESVYAFLPRNILGYVMDGTKMELRRLQARQIPLLSSRNRMVWWIVCPMTLAAIVYSLWGSSALAMLFCQALGSMILLGAVDYVEHYGLVREMDDRGRFEKVAAKHSWEANWMATSSVTFRLQRHAHHHLSASTPYQALQDNLEAPQLPASYPTMVILSLLPPLFFHVVDRRLDDYKEAQTAQLQGMKAD